MSVQKVHASVHSSIAPNGPEAETPAEERRGGGGDSGVCPGTGTLLSHEEERRSDVAPDVAEPRGPAAR